MVGGETLKVLKSAGKTPGGRENPGGPDFRMPCEWPPLLAARTRQLFDLRSAVAPASGVTGPGDFFGAPCVLFFAVERGLASDYVLFDSGLIVQSVCLAAYDRGLGSCIMAMAVRDPDTLREFLPQATDKQFVIGVALGYPDEEAPINRFQRQRAQLEEFVTWTKQSGARQRRWASQLKRKAFMEGFTIINLLGIEDSVSGRVEGLEGRFARTRLASRDIGVSHFRYAPHLRTSTGHRHGTQEEVYIVVAGAGRVLLDGTVHELRQWDVVRVAPEVVRAFAAGADGLELIAIGGPKPEGGDGEMLEVVWPD